ncbi:MAG: hypothetical protein FIB07_12350 [Candidatus Methanoperedens sp.]|nr:hypothetical protein [Candidatus Methanoperedens sp.]
MNDELNDEEIRGEKMPTGKRLVFAILGAVLAGAVIAGIYYYENTYKFRQYSIDLDSDLGKFVTKIAQDTLVSEGYDLDSFILRFIKAQNIGNDTLRLGVIFSESDVYKNITLITNHPIKNGESSVLFYAFIQPAENEKGPWKPGIVTVTWPLQYYTITKQDSMIDASLNGFKMIQIMNPTVVEMSVEQNMEQTDKINEFKDQNKFSGNKLSYDDNILILYSTDLDGIIKNSKSIEIIIDIEGNNAKIVGITKRGFENENERKTVIDKTIEKKIVIDKTVEEIEWYNNPEIVPIKPEN